MHISPSGARSTSVDWPRNLRIPFNASPSIPLTLPSPPQAEVSGFKERSADVTVPPFFLAKGESLGEGSRALPRPSIRVHLGSQIGSGTGRGCTSQR
jgi:hypothetical protein